MNIIAFMETIVSLLTIFGIVFAVFNYFKNPQVSSEKQDALMGQSITQLQTDLTNLRDNHVHTLDTKIDQTIVTVSQMGIEIAKLSTIIDERIPKKG